MDIWSFEKIFIFFLLKWSTLLMLDNSTTQKTSKVKDKFKQCDTSLSMIPSGLTWKFQPFDININKVLKDYLRKKYVNDCIKLII